MSSLATRRTRLIASLGLPLLPSQESWCPTLTRKIIKGLYSQFCWVHLSLKLPGDGAKAVPSYRGGMSGARASEKNVPSWYEGSWQGLGQRDTIPLLEQQEVRPRAPIPKDEMGAASLEKKAGKGIRKVPQAGNLHSTSAS